MIHFQWYPFADLSVEQLYAILALRADVFVVEQRCAYLDPDHKDQTAWHLLGMKKDTLVAYLRLFPPTHQTKDIVFGRVVITRASRKQGTGKQLMNAMLDFCKTHFPGVPIRCSAQYHLKAFYEGLGFTSEGEVYDEDGIPHIAMRQAF